MLLTLDRFMRRVSVVPITGCWLWMGVLNSKGYGLVRFDSSNQNKTQLTHRFAYEAMVGPIEAGLQIDHLCRNTWCCNPAHLEPVTPAVNNARSSSITAKNAAKTHCPKGHPYDDGNTYRDRHGRDCRACTRIRHTARRQAVRGSV